MDFIVVSNRSGLVGELLRTSIPEELCREGHNVSFPLSNQVGSSELFLCDVAITDHVDPQLNAALRAANPKVKIVLADPKLESPRSTKNLHTYDLLLVGSREMAAKLSKHNSNTLLFYWVPALPKATFSREMRVNSPLVIGYHGNRLHLEEMRKTVVPALNELAKSYSFRLHAHYNYEAQGLWKPPGELAARVDHHQWQGDATWRKLSRADIGIVPNLMPASNFALPIRASRVLRRFGIRQAFYRRDDTLLRYKFNSNPGRIYPFAAYSIPVVADLFPSSAEALMGGALGHLAFDQASWTSSLEELLQDNELRIRLGRSLHDGLEEKLSLRGSIARLLQKLDERGTGFCE